MSPYKQNSDKTHNERRKYSTSAAVLGESYLTDSTHTTEGTSEHVIKLTGSAIGNGQGCCTALYTRPEKMILHHVYISRLNNVNESDIAKQTTVSSTSIPQQMCVSARLRELVGGRKPQIMLSN